MRNSQLLSLSVVILAAPHMHPWAGVIIVLVAAVLAGVVKGTKYD